MIHRIILLKIVFIFSIANSNTTVKEITYEYNEEKNIISLCYKKNNCQSYKVPEALKEDILGDFSELSVDTFANNKTYLLTTLANNNGVNFCHQTYLISNNKISSELINILPEKSPDIYPDGNDLCNYTILPNNQLTSSYRIGPKWHEELYQYKNGAYVLIAIDDCVGCGETSRKYYDGRKDSKVIVGDGTFLDRKPLFGKIIIEKAPLYDEPDPDKQSKMYLIRGDKVALLDYRFIPDDRDLSYYLVSYKNPKIGVITRWVNSDDIEIIKNE